MAQSENIYGDFFVQELGAESSSSADLNYNFITYWRVGVMAISSGLLILNIVMIIKSKQYIYNTLKLFLFLQLFTLMGQIIVLFHHFMKPTDQGYFTEPQTINQIIQAIIHQNPAKMLPCSIEAYINLFCYNISYLFALLITLYVRKVIDNTHKYFMRKHTRLIVYVVIGTFLVYLPPFVLAFFPDVPYSFGPIGFELQDNIIEGKIRNYLFYCGITARQDSVWAKALSVFNMSLIPVLMFIVHIVLLMKNSRSMKFLKALEELNPRQWFILKSGTLSIFVFGFQSFNFFKYILSIFVTDSTFVIALVAICNMVFDFMPIVLVFMYYKKYYRKGKKLQEKSLVRSVNTDSFDSHDILTL